MFNKEKFAELLTIAKGPDRSLNEFAWGSGVSPSHLSRYIRQVLPNPPKAATLKKIAQNSAGRVTYEELLQVCGVTAEEEQRDENNFSKKISEVISRSGIELSSEDEENILEMLKVTLKTISTRRK